MRIANMYHFKLRNTYDTMTNISNIIEIIAMTLCNIFTSALVKAPIHAPKKGIVIGAPAPIKISLPMPKLENAATPIKEIVAKHAAVISQNLNTLRSLYVAFPTYTAIMAMIIANAMINPLDKRLKQSSTATIIETIVTKFTKGL